jgi:hypothetical protein
MFSNVSTKDLILVVENENTTTKHTKKKKRIKMKKNTSQEREGMRQLRPKHTKVRGEIDVQNFCQQKDEGDVCQ